MAVIKDKNVKTNPWYFTIEVNENGKRKRVKRRGFKTKKEAEAAQRDLLNELNKGLDIDASKVLFKDHLKSWLQDKKSTKIKQGTLETYTWLVESYIIPELGEIELGKITPRQIQDLYNKLTEQGKPCGENIQKIHTIIKSSLRKAAGWGMIIKNPADVVERPEAEEKEMLYWEDKEAHQFLKAAESDRYYHAFLLAITTGMRQGEILGLRWRDIDFINRTISVRQILTHDGKEIQSGTKTKSGIRSIGIDRITASKLQKLRHRINEEKMEYRDVYQDNDLVICTKFGTPVSPRNINRSFDRLIERAGVKKIRFHDLRHGHVVALLKMRENNKRIAERMGWASVRMLDRYAHITMHMQQETADTFGEMFFSAPTGTISL